MKFTFAVVVLALAAGAQCSLVPLHWDGHDDGSWHGDSAWTDGHWDPSHDLIGAHGYAGAHWVGAHGWAGAHGLDGTHVVGAPVVVAHAHAHPVIAAHAHAHVVPVVAQGSYVAANRGSVHVAPLAGHIQSASSINLQPAPGTL